MNAIAQAPAVPAGGPQLDNRRVIAGLIDLFVVLAGALVIGFAAGVSGAQYQKLGLALGAVILAWALYYYFACESGGGQTLGKKLMKIRVVRLDGGPAGMGDIAVRTVARMIDGLFLYLVGLVVMLVTGERRGRLGDLAAGTMIVSADVAPATAPAPPPVTSATITLPVAEPQAQPSELKELARDIMAPPAEAAEPEPEPEKDEEPVVVNSDATVSAIDLVMEEEPKDPA